MSYKVAINGFGRIGRNAFKIAMNHPEIEVVAVNDLTSTDTLAYLLKHDSNYGTYHEEVGHDAQNLIVGGKKIRVTAEKDPALLPWKDMGVQIVIESTGRFTNAEDAKKHIQAGAKRVVISGPAKGEGAGTFVIGVNDHELTAENEIVSNASCTTNCITPVAVVIEEKFGIEKAMMTTVHSYTASQSLQDAPSKDVREGRNAAENIVPTSTGAATAAAKAFPALKGKFDGLSVRVPTPVVSLSDFTFVVSKDVTIEEVNEALKSAAKEPRFTGVLDVTDEPLVSSDFIGNPHSGIVDLALTNVVGGNLLKVVAWYDNEWGYSNRLVEQVINVGEDYRLMKIYLGADHGGYELKNVLREHLAHNGYEIDDVGAKTLDPEDDYPRYAYDVASKVLGSDDDLGILICRSGQGMAIAANRVHGVRAAIAWNKETAAHARRDDNVNVLVLAPDYTDQDTAIEAVDAWLDAEFSKNPKYQRRLDQIEELYG